MKDERHIRFHCHEHGITFVARADESVPIFCDNKPDEHRLAQGFPGDAFWEYCCDCDRFFPLRQPRKGAGRPANNSCPPPCERLSVRRHLCSNCNVISFESWEVVVPSPTYSVSPTSGRIHPHCPGCLKKPSGLVRSHKCLHQGMGFTTTRASCPFCNDPIQPDVQEVASEADAPAVALAGAAAPADAPAQLKAAQPLLQLTEGDGARPDALTVGGENGSRIDAQDSGAGAGPRGTDDFARRLKRSFAGLVLQYRKRRKRYIAGTVSCATIIGLLLTQPIKNWIRRGGANHRPVITMVRPDKSKVSVDGMVTLTATARDDDNDKIHYDWRTSEGRFEGETDKQVVTLNLAGSGAESGDKITVRLFVNDEEEIGESFDTVIQVATNHKPRLPALLQSAPQVYLGDPVTLTATPQDEDVAALIYHWTTSGGSFEGDTTHSPRVVLNTTGINILAASAPVEVKLTVEDKYDVSEPQTATVTVVPRLPDKGPAPTPAPQAEAANNAPVSINCPDCSAVESGERVRLQAMPDNINVNEFTFEWRADDARLQFVGEGAERVVGKGREVTLDTAGLKALTSRREIMVWLTVTNLLTRKSRSIAQTVTVLPAEPRAPVPSAHPEPTAPASPTPSPAAKPSGR